MASCLRRYLAGFDLHEFMALYEIIKADLMTEFPRTAEHSEDREYQHLTLTSLLFLTLYKLRHMPSWGSLQAQIGFDSSGVMRSCLRVKQILWVNLKDTYASLPTDGALASDAELFFLDHNIRGIRVRVCVAVDDSYYLICKPHDIRAQRNFYSKYIEHHALKYLIVTAVLRKWIHSIEFVPTTFSDITSFRSSWVYPKLDPEGVALVGIGDKGFWIGDKPDEAPQRQLVVPFREDVVSTPPPTPRSTPPRATACLPLRHTLPDFSCVHVFSFCCPLFLTTTVVYTAD